MRELSVVLLSAPLSTVVPALAARGRYSDKGYEEIADNYNMVDPDPIIEKVMNSGHLSVLEHMGFSFAIEGVSYGWTYHICNILLTHYSLQLMENYSIKR